MTFKIPPYILDIAPYVPGKPIESLEREFGITRSIKLASNENPLGSSPKAVQAISEAIGGLNRYPDGSSHVLLGRLASHLGVNEDSLVVGNGSDDILGLLARTLLQSGDEVIIPTPSFLMYRIVTQSAGALPVETPLNGLAIDLDAILARISPLTRLIFICNPNNPTGSIITRHAFEAFLSKLPPEVVVVVDEAYIEFARDDQCMNGLQYSNGDQPVVTLRTFSKIYGLAGLRVGYGVMPPDLAELLNRVRMPFNVNTLAQYAAAAALEDLDFIAQTTTMVHQGLDFLYGELTKCGLRYYPTQSNFFLIDVQRDADEVFEDLLKQGVIVRSMSSYGFPSCIRINVGLPEENQRFLDALKLVLQSISVRH